MAPTPTQSAPALPSSDASIHSATETTQSQAPSHIPIPPSLDELRHYPNPVLASLIFIHTTPPLFSIPLCSIPLRSIPLRSILLCSVLLHSIPRCLIPLHLAPSRSISLHLVLLYLILVSKPGTRWSCRVPGRSIHSHTRTSCAESTSRSHGRVGERSALPAVRSAL